MDLQNKNSWSAAGWWLNVQRSKQRRLESTSDVKCEVILTIALCVPLFLCITLSLFKVLSSAKDKWTKDVTFATIRDSPGGLVLLGDYRGAEILYYEGITFLGTGSWSLLMAVWGGGDRCHPARHIEVGHEWAIIWCPPFYGPVWLDPWGSSPWGHLCSLCGFKYRILPTKCQLLNFVPAQSKMSIYVSRKKEVEDEVVLQLSQMIRTRSFIKFNYDREMKDLEGSSSSPWINVLKSTSSVRQNVESLHERTWQSWRMSKHTGDEHFLLTWPLASVWGVNAQVSNRSFFTHPTGELLRFRSFNLFITSSSISLSSREPSPLV